MERLIQAAEESLGLLLGQGVGVAISLLIALAILLLTRYLARSLRRLVGLAVVRTVKRPSLQSLFVQTSYVAIWVIGVLVASTMVFPSLRLGDIVGLLGLSSVAVGFAFQDIFKNFLAGVLLLLNEPFRLGDQIQVGEYEGTVEDIAIRSTQIRTYQGERIVIPNATIFTSEIQVFTAFPHRRTDLPIGVDYSTPLPQAIEVLKTGVIGVEGVLADPAPLVDVAGFGDSSIELVVRYWTRPTMAEVLRTRTRVIVALKQACDRAEIKIPFPIRTLQWQDPQQPSLVFSPESQGMNAET
ncbi:mechanosensitive ion channel family protein [Phormidium tenue FACHB-886]|nr:mechanosensitive ion channel family protein [Phormidium tenue FACHB-886]